jgi:hypothetical protein
LKNEAAHVAAGLHLRRLQVMTTSVQHTSPRGSAEIGADKLGLLSTFTATSPAPSSESGFQEVLNQGDLLPEHDEPKGSHDHAPASRERDHSGLDSAYAFTDAAVLAPPRPVVRKITERKSTDAAPEQAAPDSRATEDATKTPLSSSAAPASPGAAPAQPATPRWPAGPKQSKTASADPQVTADPPKTSPIKTLPANQAVAPKKSNITTSDPSDASPAQSSSVPPRFIAGRTIWNSGAPVELNGGVIPEPTKSAGSERKASATQVANTASPAPLTTTAVSDALSGGPAPADSATGQTQITTAPGPEMIAELMAAFALDAAIPAPPANSNGASAAQTTPEASMALETAAIPVVPVEPVPTPQPQPAHANPPKSSSQSAPLRSSDVAPTSELFSQSPAPADGDDDNSPNVTTQSDSQEPRKSEQVNAPAEWSVDNADPQTGSGANLAGAVAFEAKLTPEPAAPATAVTAPNPATLPALPAVSKYVALSADEIAATPEVKPETILKADFVAPVPPASTPMQADARTATVAQPDVPVATRMDSLIEAPAAPSTHGLTVNVREGSDEAGVNLRFIERGGEIHVSVRTSDPGLAQDLRGGLSDLTGRLQHAGIRTEISNLSAGESNTHRDSQQPAWDQRGSGRQSQDSSREQQEPRKNNPSGWRKAIEDSTGIHANSNQEQNT